MSTLTYLYQALAHARATVTEIERAIEAQAKAPSGYTGMGYGNADTNGNREAFYNWIEETENDQERKNHDR
jgi:hypothetical protein